MTADSPAIKTKFGLDLSQVSVTNAGTAIDTSTLTMPANAAVADAADGTKKTTLTYAFTGTIAVPQDANGDNIAGGTVKFTIGGQDFEIDVASADADSDGSVSATELTDAMATALNGKDLQHRRRGV